MPKEATITVQASEVISQHDLIRWLDQCVSTLWGTAMDKMYATNSPMNIIGHCIHVRDPKDKFWALDEAAGIAQSERWGHPLKLLVMLPIIANEEILKSASRFSHVKVVQTPEGEQLKLFYGMRVCKINHQDMWLVDAEKWPPQKDRIIRITWQHETQEQYIERLVKQHRNSIET